MYSNAHKITLLTALDTNVCSKGLTTLYDKYGLCSSMLATNSFATAAIVAFKIFVRNKI